MTNPRFFSPFPLSAGGRVNLSENAARHAVRVLRLKAGDALTLFDGLGGEYPSRIVVCGRDAVVADVLAWRDHECESPVVITLVQALQAGEKMDLTVQKAVELGVARIVPVTSQRSVVRLEGERAQRRVAHWRAVAASACEQCGRNRVPEVAELEGLRRWLGKPATPASALRLMLDPAASLSLQDLPRPSGDAAVELLIGAEGGLAPEEADLALLAGFVSVRLGPRVLRTETAGLAAMAAIQCLWGDFGSGESMFESAELGHTIDKETFRAEVPPLREALLDAQFDLHENGKFPVVILISGVDGAGKSETINVLYEWMDPRFLSTLAFSVPSDEERERPYMWRFWRALPPKGRIGIFAGSWYSNPIAERIRGDLTKGDLDQRMDQINRFEAMLVNEGALVLKFWFHLSRDGQKQRLKALENDPRTAWRVTRESWSRVKTYGKLQEAAGHVLRMTNTPWAPWIVVEGTDDRYRSLTVGKVVLDALQKRLADTRDRNFPVAPPIAPKIDSLDVLTALDLTATLEKKDYEKQLAKWQGRLSELVRQPEFRKHSLILAFEGSDAAGKGGSIRRVTAALDARQYQIVPVAAPTEEERAQPYLWRFWRHIPRNGRVAIFDRTWYGRVLVERVEGFCSEADWLRAYTEINDFEHELREDGVILVKFWLQISDKEQLRRFKEREKIAFKRFKITEEDWRNREKGAAYHTAVCDMVYRTSSGTSPWTLVEANDKSYARVKILRTVCERLEQVLETEKHGTRKER